jgi:hypothetical protein
MAERSLMSLVESVLPGQGTDKVAAVPGSKHEGVVTAISRVGVSIDCDALGSVLVHSSTFSDDTIHVGQFLTVYVSKVRPDGKIDALFSPPVPVPVASFADSTNNSMVPAGEAKSKLSFSELQQILIEFRDSTGFEKWYDYAQHGWEKLGSYSKIEELGEGGELYDGLSGVEVQEGKVFRIDLDGCNLEGKCAIRRPFRCACYTCSSDSPKFSAPSVFLPPQAPFPPPLASSTPSSSSDSRTTS